MSELLEKVEYERLEGFDETVKDEPKKEPTINHFLHPIDPSKMWCGKNGAKGTYKGATSPPLRNVTCPSCLHLFIEKGGDWWWHAHNHWYGTSCFANNHRGCW